MVILEKIWINTIKVKKLITTADDHKEYHELRLDWNNDRHQAIKLKGLDPESVERGLRNAVTLIKAERERKHL